MLSYVKLLDRFTFSKDNIFKILFLELHDFAKEKS